MSRMYKTFVQSMWRWVCVYLSVNLPIIFICVRACLGRSVCLFFKALISCFLMEHTPNIYCTFWHGGFPSSEEFCQILKYRKYEIGADSLWLNGDTLSGVQVVSCISQLNSPIFSMLICSHSLHHYHHYILVIDTKVVFNYQDMPFF
jgi:hypothetical protein